MIKTNIKKDTSVIEINQFKEYFIPSDNSTSFIQSLQSCEGELLKMFQENLILEY